MFISNKVLQCLNFLQIKNLKDKKKEILIYKNTTKLKTKHLKKFKMYLNKKNITKQLKVLTITTAYIKKYKAHQKKLHRKKQINLFIYKK